MSSNLRHWDLSDYSLAIIFSTGFITNMLNVLIYKKVSNCCNTLTLLIVISLCDMFFLAFKFLNIIKIYRISLFEHQCVLITVITNNLYYISTWLIVIVTLTRFLESKKTAVLSKKSCLKLLSFWMILIVLISSLSSFCLKSLPKKPYFCQIKGASNDTCFLYKSRIYPLFQAIFALILPTILLIFFNICLVIQILEKNKVSHIRNIFFKF
jgi:hypothetical protein